MRIRAALKRVLKKARSSWRQIGPFKQALVVKYRRFVLSQRVRHIHGRESINYSQEELVVICVVRNGAHYLDAFVAHYTSLGVKHIVFLDNGSTDDTIGRACAFENVTVLSADVPYSRYENVMKTYLAQRFSKDRWNLCADIDELFDYPGSDTVAIGTLLRYLNASGFTAVVAQMLDMFADGSLSHGSGGRSEDLKTRYSYYDISNILTSRYHWSELSNDDVRMHRGGIRRTLFDSMNYLTKAPLVFVGEEIRLFCGWHHAENARVADFTCVLFHYPFSGSFFAKVKEAAETKRYGYVTSDEYELYWKRLSKEPDLKFRLETARRFETILALVDEGFLVASPAYRELIRSHVAAIR